MFRVSDIFCFKGIEREISYLLRMKRFVRGRKGPWLVEAEQELDYQLVLSLVKDFGCGRGVEKHFQLEGCLKRVPWIVSELTFPCALLIALAACSRTQNLRLVVNLTRLALRKAETLGPEMPPTSRF